MINEITKKDKEQFNKLGLLINSKFDTLYDLDKIITSSYEKVFGYYVDNLLVGFIHISKMYEVVDIINIVVDLEYRRRGIASKLIDYVLVLDDEVKSLMLEVNERNDKAINLYLKCGFYEISRRNKYYGNDTAIIMKRDV